jgi:tryptophan synthase beta subunit
VRFVGVEAGGEGVEGKHSATLTYGKPGVLHGTRTYLLQVCLCLFKLAYFYLLFIYVYFV